MLFLLHGKMISNLKKKRAITSSLLFQTTFPARASARLKSTEIIARKYEMRNAQAVKCASNLNFRRNI